MEKLIFSLGVTGLGMGTVFAGLIILIVFIGVLSKMTGAASKKKTESKSVELKPVNKGEEIPGDVMAAITAAVSAYDSAPSQQLCMGGDVDPPPRHEISFQAGTDPHKRQADG